MDSNSQLFKESVNRPAVTIAIDLVFVRTLCLPNVPLGEELFF